MEELSMAKYEFEGKKHNINLKQFKYTAYADGDNYLRLNWEHKDKGKGFAPSLGELVKFDKDLEEENMPLFGLYLYYKIDGDKAILDYLCYEKGYNGEEVRIELNQKEIKMFENILSDDSKWQ